jgi:hypothetical protein
MKTCVHLWQYLGEFFLYRGIFQKKPSQWPSWCTDFCNTFIIILYMYMFRAISCSSSGGQIVIIQHLVLSVSVSDRPVHRLRKNSVTVGCILRFLAPWIVTICSYWYVGVRHPQHTQTGSNSSTVAADSSNGVTNTRCCRYSCMCSWWWVEAPPEIRRAVSRYK